MLGDGWEAGIDTANLRLLGEIRRILHNNEEQYVAKLYLPVIRWNAYCSTREPR